LVEYADKICGSYLLIKDHIFFAPGIHSKLTQKSFFADIIGHLVLLSAFGKSVPSTSFALFKKLQRNYRLGKFKVNFQNYSIRNLHKESDLFFDWYLKYCFKSPKLKKIKNILKKELTKIYKKLYFQNNTFVHRDFHASNIMVNKNKLGLIDSQDAIIGNPLYDVASLIDDVRIKLPSNLQEKLLNFYYRKSKFKKEEYKNLKNDFEILSVQRNLKILGIFVRLFKRDGKPNYLKYLPYTWSLIERRLKNPVFKNLNLLFTKHLKIKKLKKINNL